MKNKDAYRILKHLERQENTFIDVDIKVIYLPSLSKPTNEKKLIVIYEVFERLSSYHRNEKYFKDELLKYETIKGDPEEIQT